MVLNHRKKILLHKKESQIKSIEHELVKTNLKNKESESQRLVQKINYYKQDLSNFSLDILRKTDFLEQLIKDISRIKPIDNPIKDEILKNTLFQIKNQLFIDKKLNTIQKNIDKLQAEFFETLIIKHPTLTENDMHLCALYRLGLTTKEVSIIKNITLEGARTGRKRLRKKLNINTETDLVIYLKKNK